MTRKCELWLAFLVATIILYGQQPARPVAKQEVPANVGEHAAPLQPIPYSHKTHLAVGLRCQQCHADPNPGAQMTFPATATCMMCHNTIAKDRPAIIKLAQFSQSGQPIPWVRVYQITPGVTWSHRKHLEAGMQCMMCHGQVDQLNAMAETTSVTAMASCISCHASHNVSTACKTCHMWP